MTVKEIHIGNLIRLKVQEQNIQFSRMCNFLTCSEEDILKTFDCRSCDTYLLLRWSKLLEYDFFRFILVTLFFFHHVQINLPKRMKKESRILEKTFIPKK